MKITNILLLLLIIGLVAWGSFEFGNYYGALHIANIVGPALFRCIELMP